MMANPLHFDDRGQPRPQPESSSSPEISLLLACAHTHLSDPHIATIEHLLTQEIDWPLLLQLARQQGTLPLLYQSLKRMDSDLMDLPTLAQLRNAAQTIALQNTVYTQALLDILNLFAVNGVLALPFKGPVLAASAYQNISLRSFCDLDILIRPQDSWKAIEVLTQQDTYRTRREWYFLNETWERLYRQSYREIALVKGIISIDLHQELTVERYLSTQFTFEQLWQHHEAIPIASQLVPSFAPTDLLLYLCVHASKEGWCQLKWICDITEFIHSHPQLEWPTIFERAQALHCERRVLTGLLLAHKLLGLSLPDVVFSRANTDQICYTLASAFSHRFLSNQSPLSRKFSGEKFYLHLKSLENYQDRLQSWEELMRQAKTIFIKILPNSKDQDFVYLPKQLHLFYFIIRIYRLLAESILSTYK